MCYSPSTFLPRFYQDDRMDFKTHWIFDDFHEKAENLRGDIDKLFHEGPERLPFHKRTVWNYWYTNMYIYLRASPASVFAPTHHTLFMERLRHFAARRFGLKLRGEPFLSMYIDGCRQGMHNDFGNGRVAYVYSLTHWDQRHFRGGETLLYRVGATQYRLMFDSTGGIGYYERVAPRFNRLTIFDDRVPHSVDQISGTMDPKDARFVMHGHFEDSRVVAYVEGALEGAAKPMTASADS